MYTSHVFMYIHSSQPTTSDFVVVLNTGHVVTKSRDRKKVEELRSPIGTTSFDDKVTRARASTPLVRGFGVHSSSVPAHL